MGTNVTGSNARVEAYPIARQAAAAGGLGDFAEFFALNPPNSQIVPVSTGPGTGAVAFPQDGPARLATEIVRASTTTFVLPDIGIYEVVWQVSVSEAGQLMLRLNGVELPATVVGRATGTDQIIGDTLVTTVAAASILEVINPSGNPIALTITPSAGGTHPSSATLVIKKLTP